MKCVILKYQLKAKTAINSIYHHGNFGTEQQYYYQKKKKHTSLNSGVIVNGKFTKQIQYERIT